MKSIIPFFIYLLWVPFYLGAQNKPQEVKSKIESVKVFLEGAQVNRSAEVLISPGEKELIFKGLTARLSKESIQVKGEGNFTVLSVIHQLNFLEEQEKRAEIKALEAKIEKLNEAMGLAANELNIFIQEEKMLAENRSIGGTSNGVNTAELKAALDFHRQRLMEVKNRQFMLNKQIRNQKEERAQLLKQMNELNTKKDLTSSEVLVKIAAKSSEKAKFKIAYLVKEAGWYPNYDLRVKDIASPIQLTYKANVFQNSGVDWKNVKLSLSTANPNEGGLKPQLEAWFLRYNQPYPSYTPQKTSQDKNLSYVGYNRNQVQGQIFDPNGESLPGVTILYKGTSNGTVSDIDGKFTLNRDPGQTLVISYVGYETQEVRVGPNADLNIRLNEERMELQEVVVTGYASDTPNRKLSGQKKEKVKRESKRVVKPVQVEASQTQISIDFEIALPYTIPSDGKTRTVEINQHDLKAEYEYYCAPKLDEDVFLTAKVLDWEQFNLMDGEANLFFEGTFLGKSVLLPRQVSDTLEISLGRDKNVSVTRKALSDYTKRQFIGGNKTETRAYEISIRNQKNQAIKLIIEDQTPISTDKDIEVDREDLGGASLEEKTGIIRWKLNLKPSEDKKLNFRYSVKYPKDRVLYLE